MKQIDYHAKLIVHNLPDLPIRDLERLESWLKIQAKALRHESKNFSKRFTGKLMK